ncbi:unnamed protein product [Prunus armeniaca]
MAASASQKYNFSRTTLKMCRVRAFALSHMPAPPPSTMLISSPQLVPVMSSQAVVAAALLNFG